MSAPFVPDPLGALVVARSAETRQLLRGLLRLHQRHVLAESAGGAEAVRLVGELRPRLLVVDAAPDDAPLAELLRAARGAEPAARIVLLTPTGGPAPVGPDVVLRRPFRLADFGGAIGAVRDPPA